MAAWKRVVAGAAAGPLAGARIHPRVSAPLSSGSVTVPAALPLTPPATEVRQARGFHLFVRSAHVEATPAAVVAAR
jgi:hypothetical protein